jgi:hypothetical protein
MSKRTMQVSAVALATFLVPFASATGQQAGHSGFHASVGLGAASGRLECTGCDDSKQDGGALMLRFGGAVSPRFVLSGELGGWGRDREQGPGNASWVLFSTQFYPMVTNGFFIRAGLGQGQFESTWTPPGGPRDIRNKSGAFALGLGYDIAIRGGFSVTPYLDAISVWQAAPEGGDSAKRGLRIGYLGLAASWR